MTSEIMQGDCLEVMREFPDNYFSAIVTDPPYGLHFMGKDWDSFKFKPSDPSKKRPGSLTNNRVTDTNGSYRAAIYDETRNDEFQAFIQRVSREALRVLKPGGHVLMFGAPRRFHRQICALEDAGWEIRDCMMWIFGSGFPKSHNHFGIEGYGTALKPAYEPIIMAMKPLDGTFAQNAEKWGQAGINVDACRIGTMVETWPSTRSGGIWTQGEIVGAKNHNKGRWPANIMFDDEAAKMLDEQSGISRCQSTKQADKRYRASDYCGEGYYGTRSPDNSYSDSGGASRFFYCPKTSSRERNEGLKGFPVVQCSDGRSSGLSNGIPEKSLAPQKNHHPTVKPLKLMEYLIKLVMPPENGLLLDPFAGSGSTILAAKRLGFDAIGIEKQPEYCEIARARLSYEPEEPQLDMFG